MVCQLSRRPQLKGAFLRQPLPWYHPPVKIANLHRVDYLMYKHFTISFIILVSVLERTTQDRQPPSRNFEMMELRRQSFVCYHLAMQMSVYSIFDVICEKRKVKCTKCNPTS